jgi:hypothetical protein
MTSPLTRHPAARSALALALVLGALSPAWSAEPVGWLDRIDAQGVAHGWAADTDSPGASLWIHFYVEGASGNKRYAGATLANLNRPDVRRAGYQGNLGYRFTIPAWARNSQTKLLSAYAIDPQKVRNALLSGAPRTFRLASAPKRRVELLSDPRLSKGVRALKPRPANALDFVLDKAGQPVVMARPGASGDPSWKIAQHHARLTLGRGRGRALADGGYRFADPEKAFTLYPGGHCALAINSKYSYQGRFRNLNDPGYKKDWPHLYVSQKVTPRAESKIRNLSGLRLNMQLKLRYANHDTGPGYNPSWHTGHFVFFITLVDRKNRDYLWYGANLYDARGGSNNYRASEKWDGTGVGGNGTGKIIRQVARADLASAPLESRKWVTISGDLLPDIRATLQRHVANGNLRGSLDEFEIGSFLIGWEAPGLFVGTIEARGLSLQGEVR